MTTESTQPFQPVAPEPGPAPEPVAESMAEPPASPPAAAPAPGRKATGTPRWLNVALGLAVAVAIGGVAFAAGRMTAPAGFASFRNGPNGQVFSGNGNGPGVIPGGGPNDGQGGSRAFGGAASIEGTVTAMTADSMTIKTASGQEITIALDSSTTYHQQSSASSTDVKTGGTVIVRLGLGKAGSGTQTGPTANDVTVVPQ